MAQQPRDPDHVRMTFGEHLDELRRRLIFALAGLVLCTVICLVYARTVFSLVMRPAYLALRQHGQNPALQSLSPPDSFLLYIKLAVLCGLILCSPWLLWQAWQFIASGLYPHERRYVRISIVPSFLLFGSGVAFMYFMVLPMILNFFVGFNHSFPLPDWGMSALERRLYGTPETAPEALVADLPVVALLNQDPHDPPVGTLWVNQETSQLKIQGPDGVRRVMPLTAERNQTAIVNQYSINDYASFVLRMALAFGLAFQVPVVVLFLSLSGLVTVDELARMRRYVIFGISIAAALLTPPDVVSQIMLGIPMILLFEGGLVAARLLGRPQQR